MVRLIRCFRSANSFSFAARHGVPFAPALLLTLLLAGCRPSSTSLPPVLNELATLLPMAETIGDPMADTAGRDELGDTSAAAAPAGPLEHPLTLLPLAAPLNDPDLEYSGMAWYGDKLVLLPQYPSLFGNQIFALDRQAVLAYLKGESQAELVPSAIQFDDGGISGTITGFEGFEAIAFEGNQVFLTIETRQGNGMLGYVLTGAMTPDGSTLHLAPLQRAPAPAQTPIINMADEALIVDGDRVLTLYEANGIGVNPDPVANVYTLDMQVQAPVSLSNVEYRITDATDIDESGRFWAINYFFPNEGVLLPNSDPLAERYGQGKTHQKANHVERLIEFQVDAEGIRLVDSAPIQLELSQLGLPRNWEGIVRLQDGDMDGFLLVTDRFPSTQVAFVKR